MEIAWFGSGCFRLRDRNTIAVTDPYLPDPSFQNLQIKADVTTLSLIGPKIRKLVAASRPEVYTIQEPGEYEIGGIFVRGLPTHRPSVESNGQSAGFVYRYTVDGVSVCHLGQLNAPPDQEVIDQFGSPQVLIVPPGGRGSLSRADAIRLVSAMTPSYVIPMGYAAAKPAENEEAITGFLRELGMDLPEQAAAFTIRRGALPTENIEVVRLESRAKLKRPVGEKT
ncbi:MAG: MBL fold metallo-hydrolase [Chloroflexota bacterium]|jgi:L-ascorbate metabolism protein UlaG (beta-lactamase superfamily)|nr:MBL fold metallo-hydrolase [Chloroflexota bacterium]MDP6508831.1 MBL fold metallo-hydrolase [Chloroflexota bacterium]MDP6758185.1 MBL fold metallo-hydrolase [Chloroflexota bacterium]